MTTTTTWEPPATFSREEIRQASDVVLAMPDLPIKVREDIFRIRVLDLDWDIGGDVFEPEDPTRIARGADGKRVGVFLQHGGGGDHRGQRPMAQLLASKFGFKVASLTYPGHLYLYDESRDWPGDTINPDGTARTPIYNVDTPITPDQYRLVQDRKDPVLRAKYGTLMFLEAKEGTDFYYRLAAWPMLYEEAMRAVCERNFPPGEFSIYLHGHSTGGPLVHMMLQRLENVAGLLGTESSPYGAIFGKMLDQGWPFPFNWITVRTWRDIARYAGPENGQAGLRRLPWLMEEIFERWETQRQAPSIKSQHVIQFAAYHALEAGARVTAERLGMNADETEALVERFVSYPKPLSGPGVRPVPPLLYGVTRGSRDHTEERYRDILLTTLAELNPAPKARLVVWGAGVHGYMKAEEGLPKGIGPAIAKLWNDAIMGGYYLSSER
jgi:hypothetical protein